LKGKVFLLCISIILLFNKADCQIHDDSTGKLLITFTNIRSDVGNIVLGLYSGAEQWLENPAHSYSWKKEGLIDGKLIVEIDSLPYNTYACAVLDDEDRSISMKYALALPLEGWGMSSNPSFLKLVAPKFESVCFDLDCPLQRIEIKMNYLNKHKKVK
jgi:uncharacterized protein (DUF2141 family)